MFTLGADELNKWAQVEKSSDQEDENDLIMAA